jgi:hypothetical protein
VEATTSLENWQETGCRCNERPATVSSISVAVLPFRNLATSQTPTTQLGNRGRDSLLARWLDVLSCHSHVGFLGGRGPREIGARWNSLSGHRTWRSMAPAHHHGSGFSGKWLPSVVGSYDSALTHILNIRVYGAADAAVIERNWRAWNGRRGRRACHPGGMDYQRAARGGFTTRSAEARHVPSRYRLDPELRTRTWCWPVKLQCLIPLPDDGRLCSRMLRDGVAVALDGQDCMNRRRRPDPVFMHQYEGVAVWAGDHN